MREAALNAVPGLDVILQGNQAPGRTFSREASSGTGTTATAARFALPAQHAPSGGSRRWRNHA